MSMTMLRVLMGGASGDLVTESVILNFFCYIKPVEFGLLRSLFVVKNIWKFVEEKIPLPECGFDSEWTY